METSKILIVEDDVVIALDIQQKLETVGYHIMDTISSGEATLKYLENSQPDLILMDIMLSGKLDGSRQQRRLLLNIRYLLFL
ncbi:response regulator [candidate division KSB1 bacterium]|nr:response regulator [candidate division KSB1 bacterium]